MVYEALFFVFPQRLRSDEGVDTVFPMKDQKKTFKKCMTTFEFHVQHVKHKLGSLLPAVILKNKTTAEMISVALCVC